MSPDNGLTLVALEPWVLVLPAAMGAKLAMPEKDVACVTGEGSIQMMLQELSTMLQYATPVKIVNLNNGYLRNG